MSKELVSMTLRYILLPSYLPKLKYYIVFKIFIVVAITVTPYGWKLKGIEWSAVKLSYTAARKYNEWMVHTIERLISKS